MIGFTEKLRAWHLRAASGGVRPFSPSKEGVGLSSLYLEFGDRLTFEEAPMLSRDNARDQVQADALWARS